MTRRFALALAMAIASVLPAHAQHHDHEQHAPPAEPQPATGDPHARHRQSQATAADDAHAGHAMPDEPTVAAPASSPAPLPPPTPEEIAAAFPELRGMRMQEHMDDDPVLATLLFDRLEWQRARDASGLGWELQGWIGDLENRVWLRSEGERRDGSTAHGDVELLWGRPTGPWWDALAGVRHDLGEGPSRDWLAVGVQGMAPYKFEVAATGYVGTHGGLAARVEAEYELLLTNRLILQPRIETNAYSKDDPERGVGKGQADAELGLRLRYEVHRQFAPYVGYAWTRSFGHTADLAREAGHDASDGRWVAGVRFWF